MTEETMLILDQLRIMNGKIDHLTSDMAEVKCDVAVLKSDVAILKSEMAEVKADVAVLKADVAELKTDVAELKTDVAVLKSDVAELKADVSDLKREVVILKKNDQRQSNELRKIWMVLENEIRPSIKIIAEGHLNLDRKLNSMMKMYEQDQLLRLRVTNLENDVRILKDRMDKGAV
ncbi:MAG: hypothetical protein J6E42_01595 [Firmicutes bacterium]|nr:hypothetical protein [Bacillota bacterium]